MLKVEYGIKSGRFYSKQYGLLSYIYNDCTIVENSWFS